MSTVPSNLKYLWEAEFADGSSITQPMDDRYSKHDDAAEYNPSAFRDVLERHEAGTKLHQFHLIGEGHRYSVDLTDGHFEIDGVSFNAHPQMLNLEGKELAIAFWREVHRATTTAGTVNSELGLDLADDTVELSIQRYFIGWQIVGEDFTQTIAVR